MSHRTIPLPASRTCLLMLSALICAPGLRAQAAAPVSLASVTPQRAIPPGQEPHGKRVRTLIEGLEEQWRTATVSGDAATMDKLLSEDYVGISWTGQVNTKTMQLDRIRNRTSVVHSMELSDVKVKVAQSVAIVTCRAMVDSVNDGHDTSGDFRYTRVYLRQPSGAWKITNFEATRIPSPNGPGRHKGPPPNAPAPPSPTT